MILDKDEYMKQWRLRNPDKMAEYKKRAVTTYDKGKIYRIVCNITGKQYIGSTKENYLSRRLSRHRRHYEDYLKGKGYFMTSFDIIKGNNYDIFLIEEYPCNSKNELERRERYFIETMECINQVVPTRTTKEKQSQLYFCDVCKKELKLGSKLNHERSKTHLENLH